MEGQTVYSSYELLDEVFVFKNDSDDHSFLYDIINDHSHVMLDLTDQEFDKLIVKNPYIKALLKRPSKKTYPLKEYFNQIETADLSQHARDIFLLNKTSEICNNLMNVSGVLTLCSETLSEIKILTKRNYRSYSKGQASASDNNSGAWRNFFGEYNLNPLNSIVVIDNFLFNKIELGKRNLISLIKAVLPERLEISFQILIVLNNKEGKFSTEKLNKIKHDIETELKSDVQYQIDVSIVTYLSKKEEFHKRVIVTNYHLISADYGFDVFDEKGNAEKPNDIFVSGAYFSLKYNTGDSEVKLICQKLNEVKKLLDSVNNKNSKIETNLIIGNCKNRLLNDF
jgi:hypothetical protein